MIVGVKGLHAINNQNNITKYINKLNELGVEAKEFPYFKFGIAHTYLLGRIFRTLKKLDDFLEDGDSIVAHSFGCVLAIDLLNHMSTEKRQKKLKNVFLFNPSVDWDIKIEETHFKNMFIFYEPEDTMLRLAKWLPFNKLGALGKYGYRYPSEKIHNIKIADGPSGTMKHDGAMFEPNLTNYSKFIRIIEKGSVFQQKRAIRNIKKNSQQDSESN